MRELITKQDRLQYHKTIPGWCAFSQSYHKAYNAAKGGERFVEVGTWLGRSACLMAGLISQDPLKEIQFTCIDPWTDGGIDLKETKYYRDLGVAHIYDMAMMNLKPLRSWVTPIREWSPKAAELFGAESIDYIMIDGDHTYEGCKADIEGWLPKMKPGAVMAGDDYLWPGVTQAVHEKFGGRVQSFIKQKTIDYRLSVAYWEVYL